MVLDLLPSEALGAASSAEPRTETVAETPNDATAVESMMTEDEERELQELMDM